MAPIIALLTLLLLYNLTEDLTAAENPIDFTDPTDSADSIGPSAPNNSPNSPPNSPTNSRAPSSPSGPSGGPSNMPLATLADVSSDALFDQPIAIATSTPSGPQYYVWGLADYLVFSATHVTTVSMILPCRAVPGTVLVTVVPMTASWALPGTLSGAVPATSAVEIAKASGTGETTKLLLILLTMVRVEILISVPTRTKSTNLHGGDINSNTKDATKDVTWSGEEDMCAPGLGLRPS